MVFIQMFYLSFLSQSFEWRGSVVRSGREAELYAVTPDMMSEEEEEGNGYVRHPPSYCSKGLKIYSKAWYKTGYTAIAPSCGMDIGLVLLMKNH